MNRQKIADFVKDKHKDQKRKYTGEPYFVHLIAVAELAEKTNANFGYEIGLCHDLLEDTDCTVQDLAIVLADAGYSTIAVNHIIQCTVELTDEYIHEKYPKFNRKERKRLEVVRLSKTCPDSQTVKYCDLIDNTKSIVEHDHGFARVYLAEKKAVLDVMRNGDKSMYSKCLDSLSDAYKTLDAVVNT